VDLRKVGSGNIGATNALRVLGKWGYLVFAADFLKGWLAVGSALQQPATFHPTTPSSRASLQQFSLWSGISSPFGSASRVEKALPHRAES
jgi:glycerol-3-phosphate acyltransferase PlsY